MKKLISRIEESRRGNKGSGVWKCVRERHRGITPMIDTEQDDKRGKSEVKLQSMRQLTAMVAVRGRCGRCRQKRGRG